MWWLVGVVAAVVAVATYVTWTAARVDRLHARAAAAQAGLDASLVRRAATAAELAGRLPRPELGYAARVALAAEDGEREAAENDLTRQVRALPAAADDPDLASASRRVALARQVHNDLVRDALALRRKLLVRALRLARRHPVPRYFDIDDPGPAS